MRGHSPATKAELRAAWTRTYREGVGRLTDDEARYEWAAWQSVDAHEMAAIVARELEERRSHDTGIPGGADAAALSRLLERVPREPIARLIRDEALTLVEAMRVVYWAGLRKAER